MIEQTEMRHTFGVRIRRSHRRRPHSEFAFGDRTFGDCIRKIAKSSSNTQRHRTEHRTQRQNPEEGYIEKFKKIEQSGT